MDWLVNYLENLLVTKLEQAITSGTIAHSDNLNLLSSLLKLIGGTYLPKAEAFLEANLATFIEKAAGNPIQYELINLAVAYAISRGGEVGKILTATEAEVQTSIAAATAKATEAANTANEAKAAVDHITATTVPTVTALASDVGDLRTSVAEAATTAGNTASRLDVVDGHIQNLAAAADAHTQAISENATAIEQLSSAIPAGWPPATDVPHAEAAPPVNPTDSPSVSAVADPTFTTPPTEVADPSSDAPPAENIGADPLGDITGENATP